MQVRDGCEGRDMEAEATLGLCRGRGRLLAFQEVEGLSADVYEALY